MSKSAVPTVSVALERVTQRQYLDGRRWAPKFEYLANKYLVPAFGDAILTDVTAVAMEAFAARLRADGKQASTINRTFTPLRAAFRLYSEELDVKLARIPRLKERNARHGFFERAEFERFTAFLREPLQPPAWFAYFTGWRMASEVLTLRWEYLRWDSGMIVLPPETTKADKTPRQFPFTVLPELEALLRLQRDRAAALDTRPATVFFRFGGKPIKKMRLAWLGALERAGLAHKVPHDLRRTAARNLRRAGVPDDVIMALVGWSTTEMLYRYLGRADETALRNAVARLVHLGK